MSTESLNTTEDGKSQNFIGYRSLILVTLSKIASVALSYTLLWSTISEILLIFCVYLKYPIFIKLSCIFLIIPLSLVSFLIIFVQDETYNNKFYQCLACTPIFNIPAAVIISYSKQSSNLPSEDANALIVYEVFLTSTMTFPLYIINISFLLDNDAHASIYNWIQLVLCIVNFVKIVIILLSDSDNKRSIPSICNKLKATMSISLFFIPMVLFEIIYFFPFCIGYSNHILGVSNWIIIVIIFNVPKVLFVIVSRCVQDSDNNQYNIKWSGIMFILLTAPFVPYVMLMFYYGSNRTNVWRGSCNCKGFCCGNVMTQCYCVSVMYILVSIKFNTSNYIPFH